MKQKTFAEKRFFEWSEDDVSVSLRAQSGSYGGGGSEVLVIYQSKTVIGVDLYNQCLTGKVTKTLNSIKSDSDHVPCIISFRDDITIKVDEEGLGFTLSSRDYKGVQCVVQKTTGTLSPGAHAGSYNGQDAYNDMLITDGILNAKDRTVQAVGPGIKPERERPQGLDRPDYRGGHQMNEEIKTTVRRLTPLECTRLQGLPDGWVNIGDWTDENGKVHPEADTPKYKALGNSIATPFWFYLLRRISAQYERPATLGSLFSGIGGFEYCWTKCNGPGTALWASEIEQFPIAVTKYHFGEE